VGRSLERAREVTRKQEDVWFLLFVAAMLFVAAVLLHGCSVGGAPIIP